MFNKIKSLTALKGVDAKDVTSDQIQAVNDELTSLGITGVVVHSSTASVFEESEIEERENQAAQAREDELTEAHQQELTDRDDQISTLTARVEELEAAATPSPTPPKKEGDKAHESDNKTNVEKVTEEIMASARAKSAKAAKYQLPN